MDGLDDAKNDEKLTHEVAEMGDTEQPPFDTIIRAGTKPYTKTISELDRKVVSKESDTALIYKLDENPPWHLCLLLGFQQYLTALASTLVIPLVLAGPLCIGQDMVGLSELIATFIFVSGITTIVQTTIGIRLPLIQSATFSYIPPTIAILNRPEWQCPQNMTGTGSPFNESSLMNESGTWGKEVWQSRLREIQGAICMVSLFQIFLGCSGVVGFILPYIGPLTIAPTISLIGLSLFDFGAEKASTHWWIAFTMIILLAIFSEYLRWVKIPMPKACGGKDGLSSLPIFKLFPIILAVGVSWLLCFILTVSGALPDDPNTWGYQARTDIKTNVIRDTAWFHFPYPGQWGMPTVSVSAVVGMIAGVIPSVIESIGDYYACARFAGAPPPPRSAVNRGIAVEGLGCLFAGLIGTGNATTSYSSNIGAMNLTRVASRQVFHCTALLFLLFGCIGKVGAAFVTIPEPVVGGLFLSMFGLITAIGISNLQYVDLTSSRNLFVIALSFFLGLTIPYWVSRNKGSISTGVEEVDQILQVILSSGMLIGGGIGFVLDVTLPGTPEERGLTHKMSSTDDVKNCDAKPSHSIYYVPYLSKLLSSRSWMRYIPVCPASDEYTHVTSKRISADDIANV